MPGDLTPFERFRMDTIPQQCHYFGLLHEEVEPEAVGNDVRDLAAEVLATAEDYVRARDLSERADGFVSARTTLIAEETPSLRMMMLPVSIMPDWEQRLYMPFSKFASKILRHHCDGKDRRLSREVGHYVPFCDDEGIMNWESFAELFRNEFHGHHYMNERDYPSIGLQAKQKELEWRSHKRSTDDLGKRGRSKVRDNRLIHEFPPHTRRDAVYTGCLFGTGGRDNRHTLTYWDRDSMLRCLSMGTGDKLRYRILVSGPDPWDGSDEDLRVIRLTSGRANLLFGPHGKAQGIAAMLLKPSFLIHGIGCDRGHSCDRINTANLGHVPYAVCASLTDSADMLGYHATGEITGALHGPIHMEGIKAGNLLSRNVRNAICLSASNPLGRENAGDRRKHDTH